LINIAKINDDQDKTTKTMFHKITVDWLKLLLGLQKRTCEKRDSRRESLLNGIFMILG